MARTKKPTNPASRKAGSMTRAERDALRPTPQAAYLHDDPFGGQGAKHAESGGLGFTNRATRRAVTASSTFPGAWSPATNPQRQATKADRIARKAARRARGGRG